MGVRQNFLNIIDKMAGMAFGYRELPDSSKWDYFVMAQYEKNK
jgi:hypothetical protein